MIKTADELRNELRKYNPIIDDECSQVLFAELTQNNAMNIYEIKELNKDHFCYKNSIRFVKREARHLFKVLYVSLGYKSYLCPQDMPFDTVLLDTTDGEVYSVSGLLKKKYA